MSRYITINSKFQPFSFDKMLQLAQMSTQAHNELEERYSELETKSEVWQNLLNKETEGESYEKYKEFSDALKIQASELASKGLDVNSRRSLMDMRKHYANNIVPIEQAYQRRAEDIKTVKDLESRGFMVERSPSTDSLDKYVRDSNYTYGNTIDVNKMVQELNGEMQALSKELRNNPRNFTAILNGQYYQNLQRTGYTADEVAEAMQEGDTSFLREVIENKIVGSGIHDWENMYDEQDALTEYGDDTLNDLRHRLFGSMNYAIGDTRTKELSNRGWEAAPKMDPNADTTPSPHRHTITYTGTGESKTQASKILKPGSRIPISSSTAEAINVSTPELEELKTLLADEIKIRDEKIAKLKENTTLRKTSPMGYAGAIRGATAKSEKLQARIQEIEKELHEAAAQYSNIGLGDYANLEYASIIENGKNIHQSYTMVPDYFRNNATELQEHYKRVIVAIPDDKLDNNAVTFIDDEGDILKTRDGKDLKALIDNKDTSIGLSISTDESKEGAPQIRFSIAGKNYSVGNNGPDEGINKCNRALEGVYKDMRDFTNTGTSKMIETQDPTIINNLLDSNNPSIPKNILKQAVPVGTNTGIERVTFKVETGDPNYPIDIIKVYLGENNTVIGAHTMLEQMNPNSSNSAEVIGDIANSILSTYVDKYTK